jgi:Na+-driven multidrug efflux pump
LLVYFSMPLSSILMSSGKQRPWVVLQLACVAVSVLIDPWLIPWCQSNFGNGGLGVCIATVLSEVMMVAGGIWLAQQQLSGLFDKQLFRNTLIALLGGAIMAIVAMLLRGYSSWWVAPVALLAYVGVLFVSGLLNRSQLQQMRTLFSRR